jgi:hypothetical protein
VLNIRRIQVLPPQYYNYYTWMDPLKPRELIVISNGNTITIQLNVSFLLIRKDFRWKRIVAFFMDYTSSSPFILFLFVIDLVIFLSKVDICAK